MSSSPEELKYLARRCKGCDEPMELDEDGYCECCGEGK